ncbi:hypothetical protein GCM10007159_29260 [Modicisalibacter luteus]|nr:hypothetical protein GCM10007159_29260 [Halomonas lutea]
MTNATPSVGTKATYPGNWLDTSRTKPQNTRPSRPSHPNEKLKILLIFILLMHKASAAPIENSHKRAKVS